ncbi:MAG: A24 family peptidase [Planctomycetota bacterium]
MVFRHCLLFVLLTVTVYTDMAEGKIYNWCTIPALAVGLGTNYVLGGLLEGGVTGTNLLSSLIALGIVAVLFGWPYIRGGIAAGDVKFMLAVAAIGGLHNFYTAYALLYSALIGALMALLVFIWRGELRSGLGKAIRFTFSTGRIEEMGDDEEEKDAPITIPYGCAIAIGSIIAWYIVELPAGPS